MSDENLNPLRKKLENLVTEYQQKNDFTGWFEDIYTDALGNPEQVPWAKMQPHPCLENWVKNSQYNQEKSFSYWLRFRR